MQLLKNLMDVQPDEALAAKSAIEPPVVTSLLAAAKVASELDKRPPKAVFR
jgi:hypothetical protein